MYDVIIVGARCAGSPTARLLAEKGYRVLLLDKASFPSDTLSTHFIWPRGMSYLSRWGLDREVTDQTPSFSAINFTLEGISFHTETPASILHDRFRKIHGDSPRVTNRYACIRRRLLDNILVEAAVRAGAELRENVAVETLVWDQGRVIGVRGRNADGTQFEERAQVVVGADGRGSVVARLTSAHSHSLHADCSFAYWSYFSGFQMPVPTLQKRGRLSLAIVPTNFGANMTLVWGPKSEFAAFKQDIEGNFHRHLRAVNPELGELVASSGHREERFYGTAEQTAYQRPSAGAGWLLAGDAACFKDQCAAIGITHAFRDAELAAAAIDRGLTGREDPDAALQDYDRRRSADLAGHYEFTCQQARMDAATPEDLSFFQRLAADREAGNRFMAMYGDALEVDSFLKSLAPGENKMDPQTLALSHNCTDFAKPQGPDLLGRTETYHQWWQARNETGTWQYSRTLQSFPGPRARLTDDSLREISGVNFASQDYLALGNHPQVHEAAVRAIRDFGPHSAGSPMVIGNTAISQALEAELAEHLQAEQVVLFPTGWAAGFGSITGLVREYDHVVMDRLSHACLQAGVYAATRNVHRHEHLDVESAREHLRQIRQADSRGAILLISEGLFSMDADSPDLERLQAAAREFGATLFVDIAHDLGATGPGGTGQLGVQKLLGKVDLVMGSFSKTFASNGGFLATRSAAVKQYLKMYGNPHLFSNALSPVQAAVVREALRIVRSAEGEQRRQQLLKVVTAMRAEFARQDIPCYGAPSPIVPVPIGTEAQSRLAHRLLTERGIAAMIIEYPLVAIGAARFRLQAMATHSIEEAVLAAKVIGQTVKEVHGATGGHSRSIAS